MRTNIRTDKRMDVRTDMRTDMSTDMRRDMRTDMMACSVCRLIEGCLDTVSTLLCQFRSQTSPHSATMVSSVKVRFLQVDTS